VVLFSTKEETQLSKRELEILQLLAIGNRNKDVAEKLFISESTVKKHIENIYAKLQLHSRVELVNWFNQHK
jgi:LuxR family transcriptional regulator of csgAB operon